MYIYGEREKNYWWGLGWDDVFKYLLITVCAIASTVCAGNVKCRLKVCLHIIGGVFYFSNFSILEEY